MAAALVSLFSDGVPLKGRGTSSGSELTVGAASPDAEIPPMADVRNKLLMMLVEPLPVPAEPNRPLTLPDEENPPPNVAVAEFEDPAAVPVVTNSLEVKTDEAVVVCRKQEKNTSFLFIVFFFVLTSSKFQMLIWNFTLIEVKIGKF